MVMSCDIMHHLPSMHIMHHLPSMHVNIIWCLIMLYDTVMSYNVSPTVYGIYLPYDHHLTSMMHIHGIWYITYSHVIWYITFHHAWSYLVIHHLSSMHGNVIWYITYHQCKIMSYDTSTIIDAWSCHLMQRLRSCHVMHHLRSIHRHVIWYVTYF